MNGPGDGGIGPTVHFFADTHLDGRSAPRENGVTALGALVVAVIIGLFAFAALRLTPVYLNYMKVAGVLNGAYEEFDSNSPSRAAIRDSISRRFDVESISVINYRDVTITAGNGDFVLQVVYDHTVPFLGDIYFTVKFDKQVTIRR